MQELIKLNLLDLVLAVGLMVISISLSAVENLGLELNLALATGRTILQLIVLGYVLEFIFALDNVWAVLGLLAIMLTITAIVAQNWIGKKIPRVFPLVWRSIFFSTTVILLYTEFLIIQPDRWYEARYLIPLGSILVGNALNSAVVSGERLVSTVKQFSGEIETHLSLGATPQQVVKGYRRDAIRSALTPVLNQMLLIGIVSIPSFTNGQLLAGTKPLDAVSYEILIMFMIVTTNLITALLVTQGICQQLFNSLLQLNDI